MKKYYLLFLIMTPLVGSAQKDTIFTKFGKEIICTITLVNENNIFYTDKNDNGDNLELNKVEHYSYQGKSVFCTQCFPINKLNGQIEIKGKVLLEGKSKDEIFNKVVVWATSKASKESQNTSEQVIKDREVGLYKIYFKINYDYKKELRSIFYAITIQANDGYFEYSLNDFIMNKKSMEEYLKSKEKDENYRIAFDDICKKMNYTLNELKQLK